jgi:hypothetical protein
MRPIPSRYRKHRPQAARGPRRRVGPDAHGGVEVARAGDDAEPPQHSGVLLLLEFLIQFYYIAAAIFTIAAKADSTNASSAEQQLWLLEHQSVTFTLLVDHFAHALER